MLGYVISFGFKKLWSKSNITLFLHIRLDMGRYRPQISATIFIILRAIKILVGTKHVGWFCGKRKLSFWLLLGEMHVPCWHGNAFSNWESSKMLPSPTLNSNTSYYIILRLNHITYYSSLSFVNSYFILTWKYSYKIILSGWIMYLHWFIATACL